MKVLLAEKLGICPGVKNAISMAEKVLRQEASRPALRKGGARRGGVYSLGPIIHNKDVVEKLAKAGLKTVDNVEQILKFEILRSHRDSLRRTPNGGNSKFDPAPRRGGATVLIRSHGAPEVQIAALKKMGVNIVDATCVLVKKVQKIAKELRRDGYEVVVVGDENHPEVQAVVGCLPRRGAGPALRKGGAGTSSPSEGLGTAGARDVVVVADESDLHKLPKNSKLGILCQTTQSPEYFSRMLGAIAQYGFSEAKVINTLCKEAIKRQESAVQLCKQVDIMFVLGGLESANTRRLAELCKKYNNQTFHLQNWIEFDKNILFGKNIAGVTAGASTPEWIITEFVENLEAFDANSG